jgi:hypothetical protein
MLLETSIMLLDTSIMLLETSIMLLETSIMLLEASIMLTEHIYGTGFTHDDLPMFKVQAPVKASSIILWSIVVLSVAFLLLC